jgi:hypothetical protein
MKINKRQPAALPANWQPIPTVEVDMDGTNNNMVVLGVGISERDEPTTWADIKPTYKVKRAHPLVRKATQKYEIAQRVYDEKVDYFIDHPNEWDQPALNALAAEVDELYNDMLDAKHAALNECYCSTRMEMEGILCNVCKAAIQQRYGDSIPFGGEL